MFVFISDLLFFIPFGYFIYKYSRSFIQSIFALIIYCCLFHVMALTGARQFISLGLCIISYMYLEKNRIYFTILFIILASLIHLSAMLFILPLIIDFLPIKFYKRLHIIIFLFVPIIFLNVNKVIQLMGSAISIDRYSEYGEYIVQGGAYMFIFLLEGVSLFCYLYIKDEYLYNDRPFKLMYIMIFLFTVLGVLVHSNGTMIRISMYFYFYLTLLIPYSIDYCFKDRERKIVYLIAILFLILLSIKSSNTKYIFYWQ